VRCTGLSCVSTVPASAKRFMTAPILDRYQFQGGSFQGLDELALMACVRSGNYCSFGGCLLGHGMMSRMVDVVNWASIISQRKVSTPNSASTHIINPRESHMIRPCH